MSKIDFKALVESLLFEAVGPFTGIQGLDALTPENQWVFDILDKHQALFPNIPIEEKTVKACFSSAGTIPVRPSKFTVKNSLPLERLYDAIVQVVQKTSVKIIDIQSFLKDQKVIAAGANIATTISAYNTADQWDLIPTVKAAYNGLMNDYDVLGRVALEAYNDKSIIDTVNEIIKKRTDIFSRMSVGRVPWGTPFANLIKDALLNPEQYTAGNKKVPNDFKQIVDNLYFSQLLKVGVAAKELYMSGTSQQVFDKTEYENMLYNKPLPNAQPRPAGSPPGAGYTIKEINEKNTDESLALINELKNIAHYEREKVGRGERLKFAGQAMSALAGIGGATLYGGQ